MLSVMTVRIISELRRAQSLLGSVTKRFSGLLLGSMCLLTSAQSGNAVDFVASGVVEVQSFDDGRVEFDYSNTFSVTFTDCKYWFFAVFSGMTC